ncbi:hypothetical protein ACFX58_14600 [Sphingomonas sp. NCPPB 2930]
MRRRYRRQLPAVGFPGGITMGRTGLLVQARRAPRAIPDQQTKPSESRTAGFDAVLIISRLSASMPLPAAFSNVILRKRRGAMGTHNDSDATVEAFFHALADLLEFPVEDRHILAAGVPFAGPCDVLCRFQIACLQGRLHARPELILPLEEDDIQHIDAAQLLAVQQVLHSEVQWTLGHSSEGLLQANPSTWATTPEAVAQLLDLGVSLAEMMLELLGPKLPVLMKSPTTQ